LNYTDIPERIQSGMRELSLNWISSGKDLNLFSPSPFGMDRSYSCTCTQIFAIDSGTDRLHERLLQPTL
jgi:hypothetical protein